MGKKYRLVVDQFNRGAGVEFIGSYQAKTHLAQLLERVAEGETITITRHGVPVAALVPVGGEMQRDTAEVIKDIREFRSGRTLAADTLKRLIEEGRE